jgi:tetratricopeptide (TPR) repeat protein
MMLWFGLLLLLAQAGADEGARLYQAGKYAEAASAYQAAIKANPQSADGWAGMGKTLLRMGRPRDAVLCLVKALQLKPGDLGNQLTLARSYIEGGDAGAAIALLEPLDDKNPAVRRLLGEAMYRSGYYARTLQLLDGAAIERLDDRQAAGMYAVSLAKTGRIAEAQAACKRLLDPPVSPLDLDVILTYVEILDDGGRPAQALTYAERAVKEQPDNPMTHLWKARLLWHSDRAAEAGAEAERSVALAPQLPFARSLLLQIYRKQGRMEDARRQADWLREYNDRLATSGHQ